MITKLCIPDGSFVSESCRYWFEQWIDSDTRISVQKCDFDRVFHGRVNVKKYRMNEHDNQVTEYWLHTNVTGNTAVEAMKNAMSKLGEIQS